MYRSMIQATQNDLIDQGQLQVRAVSEQNLPVENAAVSISYTGELILRGEAVIRYSDFERINEELADVEEKYKKEIWTRTYKIELWAPKPLHNRSGVSVLGEIAAMSFAKTLTGIPYSPYVMDAFLVYGYSPEAASGLYEEMMEKTGRTPRLPEAVDTDAAPEALPE